MLLAGIAISALAGALNSLFSYIADMSMLKELIAKEQGKRDKKLEKITQQYAALKKEFDELKNSSTRGRRRGASQNQQNTTTANNRSRSTRRNSPS